MYASYLNYHKSRKGVTVKKGKDGFYHKFVKRFLDISLSLIALIVLSPFFVVLIISGSIAMQGNPFFVQERAGKINQMSGKEKTFRLIKFRTMSNAKDKDGKLLSDDKRLNRYGRFLRATSLDEIPELMNIFVGDMSIVGERGIIETTKKSIDFSRVVTVNSISL